MLAAPWDGILTALFTVTGLVCLGSLVARRRGRPESGGIDDHDVVDLNHLAMSVLMIAMTWLPQPDHIVWLQVALFGVGAVALIPNAIRAAGTAARIDVGGHVLLNAAMMWMLGAMPLLMAGADPGGGGGHVHPGSETGEVLTATPLWADVVNVGFVAISAAVAAWWIARAVSARGHRLHASCHAAMAAGMGAMLVLMAA